VNIGGPAQTERPKIPIIPGLSQDTAAHPRTALDGVIAEMHSAMAEITERDVTVETRRHDKEALEFDVTHCRFAEFFRALGEPELGALLICETDFDIAAAGGGEVSFTREQTIMKGAPSCTFRYKFAPR
jgi:L-2-amino-thiazoline-4-carboxylic acid hydrolase